MMNDLLRAYQILRLGPNATLAEVEEAYREATRHWHPNHFPPEPYIQEKAQAKIREINAAYHQVKNFLLEQESKEPDTASPAANEPIWRITPGPAPTSPGKTLRLMGAAQTWIREHTAPLIIGLALVAGLFFSPLIYHYLSRPSKPTPAPVQQELAALPAPGSQALPGDKAGARTAAPSPGTSAGSRTAPRVSSRYFTLGSSPEEVRAIQGPPRYLSATTWKYGLSTVTFQNRRVVGYANLSQNLRVRLTTKSQETAAGSPVYFTIGSSKDRVLAVQGTPSMVVGNTWKYGESEVKFRGGRVVSFANLADNLQVKGPGKVRAATRTAKRGPRSYFTLGSSKRQVLAVQGPPTHVWGNTWWYGYSRVNFHDDRVIGFADASRNLKARVLYTQRH